MAIPGPAPDGVCTWDHGQCEGTAYCPPRCPRFVDDEDVPMLVEPFEPRDRAALVDMYASLPADSRALGLPPKHRDSVEEWVDALAAEGVNLVARHAGDVVGHAAVVPTDGEEPELVVFVAEAYQGRGVGTELCKHAIAHAAAAGERAITLMVERGNPAALATFDGLDFDVAERWDLEVAMRLSCEEPIAAAVRRPPAERDDG